MSKDPDLCLEEHPIHLVHCLKLRGHKGRHWFTAMWTSKEEEVAEFNRALAAMLGEPMPEEQPPMNETPQPVATPGEEMCPWEEGAPHCYHDAGPAAGRCCGCGKVRPADEPQPVATDVKPGAVLGEPLPEGEEER